MSSNIQQGFKIIEVFENFLLFKEGEEMNNDYEESYKRRRWCS